MIYGLFALLLLALIPGCNCGKKEESSKAAPTKQAQMPQSADMDNNEEMMAELEMIDVEEMPEMQE